MEKAQRMMARIIQGLPNNCHNVTVLSTIGWLTIDSRIAISKLVFLWRILCLPIDNVYRRVLLHFLEAGINDDYYFNATSPTCSMLSYVKRFNLVDTLKQCMYADNSSRCNNYKSLIKRVVPSNPDILMGADNNLCILLKNHQKNIGAMKKKDFYRILT